MCVCVCVCVCVHVHVCVFFSLVNVAAWCVIFICNNNHNNFVKVIIEVFWRSHTITWARPTITHNQLIGK